MPLTFAYGSNMDADAMTRRCPSARLLGRAYLPRHRFDLLPDGYATVVRDPAATAFGVLWELSFGDFAALDRYEAVAQGAYRKISQPVLREGAVARSRPRLCRRARQERRTRAAGLYGPDRRGGAGAGPVGGLCRFPAPGRGRDRPRGAEEIPRDQELFLSLSRK